MCKKKKSAGNPANVFLMHCFSEIDLCAAVVHLLSIKYPNASLGK